MENTPKFRIGSVPYLNAAPLTRDLGNELIFATPAKLAEMLRRDELDAALVSITEVLLNDRYDILDGIAIASLGEVYSVILAHKKPLEEGNLLRHRIAHEREPVESPAGGEKLVSAVQAAGKLRRREWERFCPAHRRPGD
jgi:predicted solute-binding protein